MKPHGENIQYYESIRTTNQPNSLLNRLTNTVFYNTFKSILAMRLNTDFVYQQQSGVLTVSQKLLHALHFWRNVKNFEKQHRPPRVAVLGILPKLSVI